MTRDLPNPEAITPSEVHIPDLNIWGWQAEKVARHIVEQSPVRNPYLHRDLPQKVAGFFESYERLGFIVQAPEHQTLTQWLDELEGKKPSHSPRHWTTVAGRQLFASHIQIDRAGHPMARPIGAHIPNFEGFIETLTKTDSIKLDGNYYYLRPGESRYYSDLYKDTLCTVLGMTAEGLIRTESLEEARDTLLRRLTVLSLDFSGVTHE